MKCRDTVFVDAMDYFNLSFEFDLDRLTPGLRQLFIILMN